MPRKSRSKPNPEQKAPASRPEPSTPRKLLMGLITVGLFFGLLEGGLRLAGLPRGTFVTAFRADTGLYEPWYVEDASFGPIQYRVEANARGFRGPELRSGSDRPEVRIAAIGDSVTDGFFVDNEATYPFQLQSLLTARGYDAEVVNVARGGGSIGRELSLLAREALPLEPDVVVLTFVTNDIAEIAGRPLERLRSASLTPDAGTGLSEFLIARTAIGEALTDLYLRMRSPYYRLRDQGASNPGPVSLDDARYRIDGGRNYEANARDFLERFAGSDGVILQESIHPRVQQLARNYLTVLGDFRDLCAERQVELLFVYFPSYPEIYLPQRPSPFRRTMLESVRSMGIRAFDLTDAFRAADRSEPLHLAPIDYHLNPRGNALMAQAIADALESMNYLQPETRTR